MRLKENYIENYIEPELLNLAKILVCDKLKINTMTYHELRKARKLIHEVSLLGEYF